MKGYFLVFAVVLLFAAFAFADPVYDDVETEGILSRMRRAKCDFNACDRWCRQLKFPGGACVGDKCDCDRW
ncbi:hypothetical protein O3G_MSEX013384 [Manduca sexta]|uniref:Uncharacterized protein n=1 Tax=Manduca sexta TaxID=7130 RepID=A0A921ZS24_MANSE|nr:hypothetical protein O3G_MSEX013384 [Manduca sexta]